MLWSLLISSAVAGNLVIEAKVPVEVWVDGRMAGELALPSELHLQHAPGEAELTLVTNGVPKKVIVDVPSAGAALVHVGRTGITTGRDEAPLAVPVDGEPEQAVASEVEFRSSGREDLVLLVDEGRHLLGPSETVRVELSHGRHPMSLRNGSGTVVWAQGTLEVSGEGLVVQVADGRMPETAGGAGSFHPDQR